MSRAIFISYRRSSSAGTAGRLYDAISARFGDDRVFMDVDTLTPGRKFGPVLVDTLQHCKAVLVVIDKSWLSVTDEDGERRLDKPGDYVRLEIEQAMAAGANLFPLLVDGAAMPSSEDLPESLRPLADWQATEISSTRFRYDTTRLIEALEQTLGDAPVQPPLQKGPPAPHPIPRRTRVLAVVKRRRWALLAASVVVIAALVVTLVVRRAGAGWSDLPGLPVALEGAGVAAMDGKVWVAGGVSAGEGRPLLDTVYAYDPQTKVWASAPRLPRPIAFASLTAANGRLYLLGGQAARGAVATVLRLDNPTGSWVEDVALPQARQAGAATWDGTRLVYAGGVGIDHAASNSVYALVDGAWKSVGRLTIPRDKAAVGTDGLGTVWVLGGRNPTYGVGAFGAVDVVHVDSVTAGTPILPVHSSSAVWVPGAGLCLIGGDTGSGVTGAVSCVNPGQKIPPLPSPRAGLGAAVVGETVFVVGGYDSVRHGSTTVQALR
jgi:hypothetical protein